MKRILAIVLLLFAAPAVRAQTSGEVRIYRCTDAAGTQALRDTPCPKGQSQQTRDMLRPKDAPKTTRPAAAPTPSSASQPTPTQVVYLAPPQPMYECITHEGKRYTSDNSEGNLRWVPLWTLGYPAVRPGTSLGSNIGGPPPRPDRPMHPPMRDINWPVATGGGTWIRDDCAMLPPSETCARLRDRRSEIRTRFFNAMPSERDVLRVEERGINARLDNDCGGH
ncbi:DUF4124 domain-containing protein [Thermomonas sp. HDW16]|uniref:DUF4124 domain-containing protein n=1 Tax=Thermomonas sp. HDW16 TaxID=2714945 RepID=UPI0014092786|nr:DUF4124 domain-containing protein [Thermomonas sp. HDW16]QIL19311.1 DUF4124 domain-containing protein [Thermomonas sp. HDW16]